MVETHEEDDEHSEDTQVVESGKSLAFATCAFTRAGASIRLCRDLSGSPQRNQRCREIACRSPFRSCDACVRQGGDIDVIKDWNSKLCSFHSKHGADVRRARIGEEYAGAKIPTDFFSSGKGRGGLETSESIVPAAEKKSKLRPHPLPSPPKDRGDQKIPVDSLPSPPPDVSVPKHQEASVAPTTEPVWMKKLTPNVRHLVETNQLTTAAARKVAAYGQPLQLQKARGIIRGTLRASEL